MQIPGSKDTSSTFRTLEHPSLTDKVYSLMRDGILRQVLPLGSKLSDEAIAADLGISRTPVREAINRLVAEGLVVGTRGKGFSVVQLSAQDVEEIFEVRLALEILAVKKACRMTDRSLEAFAPLMRDHLAAIESGDVETSIRFDSMFHERIVQLSRNKWIADALNRLRAYTFIVMRLHCRDVKDARVSYEDHKRILEALSEGDELKAERLLKTHIQRVRTELVMSILGQ